MLRNFLNKKRNKSIVDSDITNEASDEAEIRLTKDDVLKTFVVDKKDIVINEDEPTSEDNKDVAGNVDEIESESSEIIDSEETQSTETETINEVNTGVNMEDIKSLVIDFFNFKKEKEENSVTEDGENMTVETQNTEDIQEQLKLAQEKVAEVEQAKADELAQAEAKLQETQAKLDEINKQKEEDKIKAEKETISQLVQSEISFLEGTPEENSEKLFELKYSLGEEKAELFDFVIDSLKSKSNKIESLLGEDGENIQEDNLSVEEKVDRLTKEKMEKENKSEAIAFNEVLEENPELNKALFEKMV
jgi:hypothetical protein